MQPVFTSKWVCVDDDNLFQVCYSQQFRQYDLYYVYLYGFKSTQEALPEVHINEDGRIYCGALETATSYTPSIFQKPGHWQTGLESTILSPDVKTNSPMDRIFHISYHFIFWNIYVEPLVDLFLLGSAYLRIWVPAFVHLGPYCQKHFRKQTLCTVLGFGLETTTWFTTCYFHCD